MLILKWKEQLQNAYINVKSRLRAVHYGLMDPLCKKALLLESKFHLIGVRRKLIFKKSKSFVNKKEISSYFSQLSFYA